MWSGRHPCERWISADMSLVAASTVRAALAPRAMNPSIAPTDGPFSSSSSVPTDGSAMNAGTSLPSSSTP